MRTGGVKADAGAADAAVGLYEALGRSPSLAVTVTLEDALAVVERPNYPGTGPELRPNWSLALPEALERIEHDPGPKRIAGALHRGQR